MSTPTPNTLFSKRRPSTKRRQRRALPLEPNATDSNENAKAASDISSSVNSKTNAISHPRVRSGRRRVMRAQPDMDGYEQSRNEGQNDAVDYSAAGLRRLRVAQNGDDPGKGDDDTSASATAKRVETDVSMPTAQGEPPTKAPLPTERSKPFTNLCTNPPPHATRSAADPFSESWRGAIKDDEIQVLPPPEPATLLDEGDDDEWISAQLRRAGKFRAAEASDAQIRHMIESEEQCVRSDKRVQNARKRAAAGLKEAEERRLYGGEKVKGMAKAETEAEERFAMLEAGVGKAEGRAEFYERLGLFMAKICVCMREQEVELREFAERAIEVWGVEAEGVRRNLEGGVDEFGRLRGGRLEIDVEKEELGVSPLREAGFGLGDVMEKVGEWKGRYAADYELLKLDMVEVVVGLCGGAGDMEWVLVVDEAVVRAALKEGGVLQRMGAAWVNAKMRVRDRETREMVGAVAKVLQVDLTERIRMEVAACLKLGEARECLEGAVDLCTMAGRDFGVDDWLAMVHKSSEHLDDSTLNLLQAVKWQH